MEQVEAWLKRWAIEQSTSNRTVGWPKCSTLIFQSLKWSQQNEKRKW